MEMKIIYDTQTVWVATEEDTYTALENFKDGRYPVRGWTSSFGKNETDVLVLPWEYLT